MAEWKQVTCCPYCGGELEISEHFSLSHDYRITKSGVLSKRFKISDTGPLNCTTGYCFGCGRAFDEDEIAAENDGTVWLRVPEEY